MFSRIINTGKNPVSIFLDEEAKVKIIELKPQERVVLSTQNERGVFMNSEEENPIEYVDFHINIWPNDKLIDLEELECQNGGCRNESNG